MQRYTIAVALAAWERETLSGRTKEGLAATFRRGEKLGRPHKLKKSDVIAVIKKLENDPSITLTSIAKELSVNPKTLRRSINRLSRKEPWNYNEKLSIIVII